LRELNRADITADEYVRLERVDALLRRYAPLFFDAGERRSSVQMADLLREGDHSPTARLSR
jgi:hypothetical protein